MESTTHFLRCSRDSNIPARFGKGFWSPYFHDDASVTQLIAVALFYTFDNTTIVELDQ